MKYLIETTEVYRADTQKEAEALIEEAKATGALAKYSCTYKERKTKEEEDSWYKVVLNKRFCSEKEPEPTYTITYEKDEL